VPDFVDSVRALAITVPVQAFGNQQNLVISTTEAFWEIGIGPLIEQGASIKYVERMSTIRINVSYPWKPIIGRVLEDLGSPIHSQEYVSNCLHLQ
jgi:hypothetical protein